MILRALKLGDFLTAVPAYRAIRRAFPNAHITLAAPREFAPLAQLLDGVIDEVAHARELAPLPRRLENSDIGIDLHGKGPQCHRLLLDVRVKRLLAFRHPDVAESAFGPDHRPEEHEVSRWCRLLEHFGIRTDASELDLAVPLVTVPHRVRGATLLHPGASSEARCWPIERWSDVARSERRAGRRVIITGGPSEVERGHAIAAAAGVPIVDVYAGKTSVRELAALVAASARVVCGDTGTAHLATAFRRPSVVLFGPTPPSTWGPPRRPFHRVLWNGQSGNPHAATIDPGLAAISTDSVIAALRSLPVA